MGRPLQRPPGRNSDSLSIFGDECLGTEAIVHSNLDLVDGTAVPRDGCAIVRNRGARAEVDVVVFRLCRPIVSKVEFEAGAYHPATAMTAGTEAIAYGSETENIGRADGRASLSDARRESPRTKRPIFGSEIASPAYFVISPGAAALQEDERSFPRISKTGCGRRYPVHIVLAGEQRRGKCTGGKSRGITATASAWARSLEIGGAQLALDAQHPVIDELVVVAKLSPAE